MSDVLNKSTIIVPANVLSQQGVADLMEENRLLKEKLRKYVQANDELSATVEDLHSLLAVLAWDAGGKLTADLSKQYDIEGKTVKVEMVDEDLVQICIEETVQDDVVVQ